jgi:hypothetical protein
MKEVHLMERCISAFYSRIYVGMPVIEPDLRSLNGHSGDKKQIVKPTCKKTDFYI